MADRPAAGCPAPRSIELLVREDIKVTSAPVAADILTALGSDVRLAVEDDVELSPEKLLFVRGSALWYRRTMARLKALSPAERPQLLVWHTEGLPMPAAAGLPREPLSLREIAKIVLRDRRINDQYSNARYLRRFAVGDVDLTLAVTNGAYLAYLAEHGIEAELVPVGYHASYGRLLGIERDIDVLFLGEYQVRRRRHILGSLRAAGIDVVALGSQSPARGYWGDARTTLLNRTRILLHVPRYPGHLSDRFLMGMANGALIVSEPMVRPEPFVPGAHYVECTADEMAETVRAYLEDEEARRSIAEAAHRFLTEELTLEGTYARLLELAEERQRDARSRQAAR